MKMLQVRTYGFHSNIIWWLNGLCLLGSTELKCVCLLFLLNPPQAIYTITCYYTHAANGITEAEEFFNDLFMVTRWSALLLNQGFIHILSEIYVICGYRHFPSCCQVIEMQSPWFRKVFITVLCIYKAINDFQSHFTYTAIILSVLPHRIVALTEDKCRDSGLCMHLGI